MGSVHAAKRLKNGGNFHTEGSKIMLLADILKPYVTDWLKDSKNSDGLPVQPATVRAISLNMAQDIIKQSV